MKYAILLDGAFFIKQFQHFHKNFPSEKDVMRLVDNISKHPYLEGSSLLRTYFYHAPPFSGSIENPFSEEPYYFNEYEYRNQRNLIENLKKTPFMALRLGSLTINGWNLSRQVKDDLRHGTRDQLTSADFVPNVQQKGVDMCIGLDVATLSTSDQVDKLVVVTSDTDFVPSFKFARREGTQVFLCCIGHKVHESLITHNDGVLWDVKC